MYGAFHEQKLVGIGILQPNVAAGTAQLAYLHVSNGYRQKGIGNRIVEVLIGEARRSGAVRMYVSATPSDSAVNFYMSQGFKPTATPIPSQLDLRSEDYRAWLARARRLLAGLEPRSKSSASTTFSTSAVLSLPSPTVRSNYSRSFRPERLLEPACASGVFL